MFASNKIESVDNLPANDGEESGDTPTNNNQHTKKKKKKKIVFVINQKLDGDIIISSEGLLEGRTKRGKEALNLEMTAKQRHKSVTKNKSASTNRSTASTQGNSKAAKMARQRSGTNVSSGFDSTIKIEDQAVQIQVAKRGSKVVTIVRGMSTSLDDRKSLLKKLKAQVGGGGTIVDGVIELQGPHAEKALKEMRSRGFVEARIIGK